MRFYVVKRVDTPTIFFFVGILIAVASLQSAGQLAVMSRWLAVIEYLAGAGAYWLQVQIIGIH